MIKVRYPAPLSLSVSSDFGRNLFVPWLDEFLLDFPQLQVRLHLGDNISSFYHDKIDVAGALRQTAGLQTKWHFRSAVLIVSCALT